MKKDTGTKPSEFIEFDIYYKPDSSYSFPSFEIIKKSTVNIAITNSDGKKTSICFKGTGGRYKTIPGSISSLVLLQGSYETSFEPNEQTNEIYKISINPV